MASLESHAQWLFEKKKDNAFCVHSRRGVMTRVSIRIRHRFTAMRRRFFVLDGACSPTSFPSSQPLTAASALIGPAVDSSFLPPR